MRKHPLLIVLLLVASLYAVKLVDNEHQDQKFLIYEFQFKQIMDSDRPVILNRHRISTAKGHYCTAIITHAIKVSDNLILDQILEQNEEEGETVGKVSLIR